MGAKVCGQTLCLLFIPPSLGEDRLRNSLYSLPFCEMEANFDQFVLEGVLRVQAGGRHTRYPVSSGGRMVTDPFSVSRFSIAHGHNSKLSWPGSVPCTSSEARACSTLTVSTTADRSRYGQACSSPASLCASPVSFSVVASPPFCWRLTLASLPAACLAEICSSIPLSGSIYVWAAEAGGKKYGRFFGFVV